MEKKISINFIKTELENNFTSVYKPFTNFPNNNPVWSTCMATAKNASVLNNIIFCNDILKLPPVKVFLALNPNIASNIDNFQKKGIGAFWGFIFKSIFEYTSQKKTSTGNKDIKTATYFYNQANNLKIKVSQ
ncbi:hypothetical protein [Clostridium luticellarii]|jgi:hypothetical protein|uniref:Uncharacterized protein n=1 Tax=Clostridium luticellarii TaxID=1691940 RepID=A0A2T0BC69_9CLOT|nr:hypothetical protein [Clostridium luticellarii]PRR81489.1 hypothetical protein CLLU_31190 [Clostridium luticellarii]